MAEATEAAEETDGKFLHCNLLKPMSNTNFFNLASALVATLAPVIIVSLSVLAHPVEVAAAMVNLVVVMAEAVASTAVVLLYPPTLAVIVAAETQAGAAATILPTGLAIKKP